LKITEFCPSGFYCASVGCRLSLIGQRILEGLSEKVASSRESVFYGGIKSLMENLGYPKQKLTKEGYEATQAIITYRRDRLVVLPTGFVVKITHIPSEREPEKDYRRILVIVVPLLKALMRDQGLNL